MWIADAYAGYGYDSAYYYTGYGYDPAYASYQAAQPGVDTGIDNSYAAQGYEPAAEEAADDERCISRWLFRSSRIGHSISVFRWQPLCIQGSLSLLGCTCRMSWPAAIGSRLCPPWMLTFLPFLVSVRRCNLQMETQRGEQSDEPSKVLAGRLA